MKAPVHKVRAHVGRNPVAQAVARRLLQSAVLDQKIALYTLASGEPCAALLDGVATILHTVRLACQMEQLDSVDTRIVKSGLNACLQVVQSDCYDSLQTVAIAHALDRALVLAGQVKITSIQKALQ